MKYEQNQAHYIAATCILVHDGKFLITKRAGWEKSFPGKWTVPGGKLEILNYALRKKDTSEHWYNILEDLVKREVKEEVGLDIENIGYVTSLVYVRPDNIPTLIVSLYAEPIEKEIKLCNALTDFAWVTFEEAKDYELIEGIYDELRILEEKLKTGKMREWGND